MLVNIKQKIGCWFHERWRTEVVLNPVMSRILGWQWRDLCNRHERLHAGSDPDSRVCEWVDSSFLTVTRFFPRVGSRLLARSIMDWPHRLVAVQKQSMSASKPKISIILPVGGSDRLALFECVLASLLGQSCQELEIIVVEHDRVPIYERVCPSGIKYIFRQRDDDEPFNKSMLMNLGVDHAEARYVLLHDADIVLPATYVESILEKLESGWEAVQPIRFLFCLDQLGSDLFMQSGGNSIPEHVDSVLQNFPGGSTALRKKTYWALGGHDETFQGWGGEDLEFVERLSTARLFQGAYCPAIHLWHPPSPKKANGDWNRTFLKNLRRTAVKERIRVLRERNLAGRDA